MGAARPLSLPPIARQTLRLHLAYGVLDAIAGGIVANAPVVALKEMGAPDWQLGLNLTLSGIGMLFTLYLSSWMATRPKMPFVFVPGLACATATATMTLAGDSFWFLFLGGLGLAFSSISRPAIAAVLRVNYPATDRGAATGEVRRWSSLAYLLAFLGSAMLLDRVAADPMPVVRCQFALAGGLSLVSYLCFRRIRVQEDAAQLTSDLSPRIVESLGASLQVLRTDARFRCYLLSGFLYGFSALIYVSYIPAFLVEGLHYSYIQCALLIEVIPSIAAFLTTGLLGRWVDRCNPWSAWAGIRILWGLDPLILAVTSLCARWLPGASAILPALARVSRGSVQGASWILWWQVGVNHFARPGADTSRYLGLLVFLNGIMRMTAPACGAWILSVPGSSRTVLFLVGGVGVILSGLHALWRARIERGNQRFATMADFEAYCNRVDV